MKKILCVFLASVAAGCAVEAEPGDELDVGETVSEIVVPSATRLDALSSPARIFAPVAGVDSTTYHEEWDRLQQLGYFPLTLSSVRMPGGETRFSSVFHKDANVETFYSFRGMTLDELNTTHAERTQLGYRRIDLTARPTSSGQRYDAAWVKETVRPASASFVDLTRAQLDTRINEQRNLGRRPLRIHGYLSGSATRYSAVFVQDAVGTNFRVAIDETSSGFQDEFDANADDGFYLVDKAAYAIGSSVRYVGVFTNNALGATSYASRSGMTAADFADRQVEYARQGYVMLDVEYYSVSTSSSDPRFMAIWAQFEDTNVRSNLNLSTTGTASWPQNAKTALTNLRNQLAAYPARAGFVIEDLRTGNYLAFRMNDPFYMASTAKVLIAAAVLDRIDDDALDADTNDITLNTMLAFTAGDILETNDQPTVTGSFTVQQTLAWMINNSSTNATDRLVRLLGPAAINDFLRDSEIVDVGEVTSICELDRRIMERRGACIRTSMTCREFERWFRDGQQPPAAGQACINSLTGTTAEAYDGYYATLANSITPLQYARLWRRLLEADIISPTSADTLVQVLDGTGAGWISGLSPFADVLGTKFGSKRSVQAVVGMGYDQITGQSTTNDVGEFSFSLFTEGFAQSDANEDAAQDLLNGAAVNAMTILDAIAAMP